MYRTKFWVITLIVALPLFFVARHIWPFHDGVSDEVKNFFSVVTALESLFSGVGVAFVFVVISKYKDKIKSWHLFDWLVFISIAWILISGYPHDNSHIAQEAHAADLIGIEIFFHGTLALSALFVMHEFVRKLKR